VSYLNDQQLKNLIEIGKHKSMNEASAILHVTPQALSISIKSLEKETGISLVETTFSGSKLTSKGVILAELAAQFLSQVESLKNIDNIDESITPIENIIFYSAPGICTLYLEKLYEYFHAKNIYCHIDFFTQTSPELIQNIKNGTISYAYLHQTYINGQQLIDMQGLCFQELKRTRIVAAVDENHPLAKFKTVSLKTILKYPLICFPNADSILKSLSKIFNMEPVLLAIPSHELSESVLRHSSSILLTNKNSLSSFAGDTVVLNIKDMNYTSFGVVYNPDYNFSYEQKQHLKLLNDFFLINYDF